MDDIDESWTEDFKELERPYDQFYKDRSQSIKLIFLYANSLKELVTVRSERIMLDSDNLLKKKSLYKIITSNNSLNNTRYKLNSILRFNIDANPEDAIDGLNYSTAEDFSHEDSYMKDVHFLDTICTFQDLNTLFLLFQEDSKTNRQRGSRKTVFKTLTRKTRRKRA